MLTLDLRHYQCPQQFVQFKLGLKKSHFEQSKIKFLIDLEQPITDIELFLKKNNYRYQFDKQSSLLIVEPLGV
ncbi:hypothetical protein J8L70_08610 [Pseudoalteromonas sp. MMG010]|uniref:sulfurtransferase TusA family protein n=1 Tax=Pseudoalteromonas sp. MMG010 TaxID=2822685 RepID=UPI001B3A1B8B|nr:sulfurtransferase TusA family protein [Pseudoalteromonas sp. MMG010]MBQ4833299.1 hypothetical protein [Pseudoalteromonas sp. MMG010]